MAERIIWRFNKRPEGANLESAFELANEQIPALNQGEILIRNQYIGMDAGTRNWLKARQKSFAPPLPLGSAMVGILIGTIEASQRPNYHAGQLVRAWGQWSNYSIVIPEEATVHVLDQDIDDIRHYLGLLGPTGLTAFFGVTDVGKAKKGETFVVSAAGGATGSVAINLISEHQCVAIVGQLARWLLCSDRTGHKTTVQTKQQPIRNWTLHGIIGTKGGIE